MSTKPNNRILVVGSVAFDVLFEVTSPIMDQVNVKEGKAGKQSMMFTSKNKVEVCGGTAGNIAYGLGLLGTKPLLFSAVGKDFKLKYGKLLSSLGVDLTMRVDEDTYTAVYYGMTDPKKDQVGIWQPNAYGDIESISLRDVLNHREIESISFAIFAPGTPKSTLRHMKELRAQNENAILIFDPGQSLAALYTNDSFQNALNLSNMLIGNDIEIKYAKKYFGFSLEKYTNEGKICIETRGKEGSIIHRKEGITRVPSFKPTKIVDPTGAGDAYRAGLLFGLQSGFTLPESCLIASRVASRAIEFRGGQEYKITPKEVCS